VNRIVLDASALLAVIHQERGSEKLTADLLAQAVLSTVNLAEVQGKLVSSGWSPDDAWEDATGLVREIVPFTPAHARIVGDLIAETRFLGLSLADRACLALGLDLKASVYTADKTWKNLKTGPTVHVIR
jgi:PIN domain nuclease of toxin-antitoxin system